MPSAIVSNVLKPAKLEIGLVVGVPHFVQEGETIKVDTTEGKYLERVRG
jgi:elongation factor P